MAIRIIKAKQVSNKVHIETREEVRRLVIKVWDQFKMPQRRNLIAGIIRGYALYETRDGGCQETRAELLFLSKVADIRASL